MRKDGLETVKFDAWKPEMVSDLGVQPQMCEHGESVA